MNCPHQADTIELNRPLQIVITDMMIWHYFIELNAFEAANKTVISYITPKDPGSFQGHNRIICLV
jgi:hypothetical protein